MKTLLLKRCLAALIALIPHWGFAHELSCDVESQTLSISRSGSQAATFCFKGRPLSLGYEKAKRTITISKNAKKTALESVAKGFIPDPGMMHFVGFLPPELQPYVSKGIVLLRTVGRSTAGDGRGQCGGGDEIYLHAVDVSRPVVKALGRVKIGSCLESIELYEQNGSDDFSSFSVKDGKLAITFLFLNGQPGNPVAVLSDDFRSLQIISQKERTD